MLGWRGWNVLPKRNRVTKLLFPGGNIDSTLRTFLALIDQQGRPERGPCIIRQGYVNVSLHLAEVHWKIIRDHISGDRFVPSQVVLSGDTFKKVSQMESVITIGTYSQAACR